MARDASRVLLRSHVPVLIVLLVAAGDSIGDVGVMGSFDLSIGGGITASRQLLSAPWTSSAPDRTCWPSYDGNCRAGDFALLATNAPAPTSLGGRLLLKTLAQGYQCWSHQTIDECQADRENRCSWLSDNSLCNTNSTTQLLTVREALLCPGSLSEQLFQCSIKMKETDCKAVSGCSWSSAAAACIPATVAILAAEELERLLPSVAKLDASVWGCCEGHRILKAMTACSSADTLTACSSPDCRWDFSSASCSLSQQGLLGKVLAREEGPLVEYIQQSDSTCGVNPGNLGSCGSSDVFDIDLNKVARYAAWTPTVEERGSCGGELISGNFTPESGTKASDQPITAMNGTGQGSQGSQGDSRGYVKAIGVASMGKKLETVFSVCGMLVMMGAVVLMVM